MGLILSAEAIHYRYADDSIGLADCSLQIESGTKNALLGANGSGKTTLMQHFNGSYARAGAVITLIYLVGMVVIWLAPETKDRPLPE